MNPIERLRKTLNLVGIDEATWNKLMPDERYKTFKMQVNKARLKYHPDRVNRDHPNITVEERVEYEANIKLLNDLDYASSTLDFKDASSFSSGPELMKPEVFFREFKRSVEASLGEGKRFKDWKNAYEHYFEPKKRSFRGYRHKLETHPVDYEKEFEKGLVKGIYNAFVVPGHSNDYGAGEDYLPPAFRDEEELLIKICAHQRHTGYEVPPIVSAASNRLKLKESFWRAAIAANPKAALGLLDAARALEEKEVDRLLNEKAGPVLLPLSQRLRNDKALMVSVIQRYPSFVGHIGDGLADDDTLLLYTVKQEPLNTLKRASNRLRNILDPLVEQALLADIYAIEHVVVDTHDSTQLEAYRGWIEKAWKDLRQHEEAFIPFVDQSHPKSRQHFISLLQEPLKQEATELFIATERLIQALNMFIEKTEKALNESTPGLSDVHNFFTYTLFNKAEPKKQLEASKTLLEHLKNKPLSGLAAYNGKLRDNISSEYYDILDKTTLKTSLDQWTQLSKNMFKDGDVQDRPAPR